MAGRTLTYTLNMSQSPGGLHAGVNTITFDVNSGTTKFGTASDVWLLGKIPHGAVVVGGAINFGIQANAAATFTMLLLSDEGAGTYSTLVALAGGTALTSNATTVQRYHIASVHKVSYSDDRAIRFATLALNCTVGLSETVSFSFQGFLQYVADGRSL